jgi:hypothetical protein
MTIDSKIRSNQTVDLLCKLYAEVYAPQAAGGRRNYISSILNAKMILACAAAASLSLSAIGLSPWLIAKFARGDHPPVFATLNVVTRATCC